MCHLIIYKIIKQFFLLIITVQLLYFKMFNTSIIDKFDRLLRLVSDYGRSYLDSDK